VTSPSQSVAASSPGKSAERRVNRRVLLISLLLAVPLLLVLFMNLGRDPHTVISPLIGRPAPPFSLPRVGGGPTVSLADLRGHAVVLNFWATWCVPCFEEHAVLAHGAQENPGVQFLGLIYEDDEDQVKAFLDRQGKAYPSLMDPGERTAIAFGVFGVPETYFIDAQGTIVAKFVGPLTEATLAENLQKAGVGEK
jgi:cytochrome c biogenesis protein CcmG/thiol:disulfide interchange protein DsbE